MRTKLFLPVAIMLTVLSGGCKKNVDSNPSSATLKPTSINSLSLQPQARVELGVAGNFVILSKTGITDVYKSAVTGDVGTSPITGAALLLSCAEVTGAIYTVDAVQVC